jgi:hypothetical protein
MYIVPILLPDLKTVCLQGFFLDMHYNVNLKVK